MAQGRYDRLIFNGKIKSFPRIKINQRPTDIFVPYNAQKTRLDRIAADIYQDDTLYWLILLGNPQYYMEYDIPANSVIRVPYPLNDVLAEFELKQKNNQVT